MNSLSLRSSPHPINSTISLRHRTTTTCGILTIRNAIPARDRVIDFGKYSGKMLGALPSNYLKWVSNNLRARDFEEWAKLADEVLDDPVYKDRLEWELAERLLSGDVSNSKMMQNGAVSELLEISERLGWNNEDKVGWAKVDFGLLGTSKGGRIPRVSSTGALARSNRDVGLEKVKPNFVENGPVEEGRRRERRERLKLRRKRNNNNNGVENGERLGINVNDKVDFGNSSEGKFGEKLRLSEEFPQDDHYEEIKKGAFLGREAFLKKVLNRRR